MSPGVRGHRGHTAYHLSQQRSHSLPPLTTEVTEVTQPTSHNRGHTAYHLSQQRSQRSHSLPLTTEVTWPTTSHNRGHRGHTAYLSQQSRLPKLHLQRVWVNTSSLTLLLFGDSSRCRPREEDVFPSPAPSLASSLPSPSVPSPSLSDVSSSPSELRPFCESWSRAGVCNN